MASATSTGSEIYSSSQIRREASLDNKKRKKGGVLNTNKLTSSQPSLTTHFTKHLSTQVTTQYASFVLPASTTAAAVILPLAFNGTFGVHNCFNTENAPSCGLAYVNGLWEILNLPGVEVTVRRKSLPFVVVAMKV